MTDRLSDRTLDTLPEAVARPRYDRSTLATGIVHLGIGAFHRGHQAEYTDDALGLADAEPSWGICGVSLRSPATRDALAPQNGLFTVAARDGASVSARVVGSVTGLLVGPEDPAAVIAALAAPTTRIVTTTVTEKGYCHDPATGALNDAHPDIAADLAAPDWPRSAIGYLVAGLERRRQTGLGPFTVLCCDNLPNNGATVRRVVRRFAELHDPILAEWIGDYGAFPSTMVDRIVPATTDADRARIAELLGVEDAWPVMTEPFKQWVIEDAFAAGRPAWERAGAQLVRDVAPFELMKLRLLNGSHSTMAYLGFLAGHDTIAGTIGDPPFHRLVRGLMDDEVGPTVPQPEGTDVDAYKDALLARFANPALQHQTRQIAMDGSQKLPQRLLAPARERLAAGRPVRLIGLAVAGWLRYVGGIDERGNAYAVDDPLAERLRALADGHREDPDGYVRSLLTVGEVFSADLPQAAPFVDAVTEAMRGLFRDGARSTVGALTGSA